MLVCHMGGNPGRGQLGASSFLAAAGPGLGSSDRPLLARSPLLLLLFSLMLLVLLSLSLLLALLVLLLLLLALLLSELVLLASMPLDPLWRW